MNFCVTFLFCLIVTAKHAFFAPAVLQAQQQEQDDSVWLEVKVIYWAGQKLHSGLKFKNKIKLKKKKRNKPQEKV